MSRYIDAEKLVERIKASPVFPNMGEDGYFIRGGVCDLIEMQPTVDAVEVVRCKDCKYYQDNNGGYPNEGCRWGHEETPDADDYCSFGERIAENE